MPAPLDALGSIASLPDGVLDRQLPLPDRPDATIKFAVYECLRGEQALAATAVARSETERILDLAQMAYGELVGLLVGSDDSLLDGVRDGEWTLRDLLRHAIAVELRYAAQVSWSATRGDADPLAIPPKLLPCDRLSPPEPEFADSRRGGIARLVDLLGDARVQSDRRLESIGSDALDRPSLWGTITLSTRMRMHQMAAHLTEVASQSEKMLPTIVEAREARRILRRCCALRGWHERWSPEEARRNIDALYRMVAAAADRWAVTTS